MMRYKVDPANPQTILTYEEGDDGMVKMLAIAASAAVAMVFVNMLNRLAERAERGVPDCREKEYYDVPQCKKVMEVDSDG